MAGFKMNYVKKMALVPIEELNQHKEKLTPLLASHASIEKPSESTSILEETDQHDKDKQQETRLKPAQSKVFDSLDKEIIDILNNPEMDSDQKIAQYLHALKRYLTFQGKLFPIAPMGQIEQDEEILKAGYNKDSYEPRAFKLSTKKNRKKLHPKLIKEGSQLMKIIDVQIPSNVISWNKKFEVILHNQLIPKSNILDLITNVLKKEPNLDQTGFEDFRQVLKNWGNKKRKFIYKPKVSDIIEEPEIEEYESNYSDDEFKTPVKDFFKANTGSSSDDDDDNKQDGKGIRITNWTRL